MITVGLSLAQGVEHRGVGLVWPLFLTLGAQSPTAALRPHVLVLRRFIRIHRLRCEIESS